MKSKASSFGSFTFLQERVFKDVKVKDIWSQPLRNTRIVCKEMYGFVWTHSKIKEVNIQHKRELRLRIKKLKLKNELLICDHLRENCYEDKKKSVILKNKSPYLSLTN